VLAKDLSECHNAQIFYAEVGDVFGTLPNKYFFSFFKASSALRHIVIVSIAACADNRSFSCPYLQFERTVYIFLHTD